MDNKNKKKIIVLTIALSLVLLIGSSYAYLKVSKISDNPYVMNVGKLEVTFTSGPNNLTLNNKYPISDSEGKNSNEELIFTVKNTGTIGAYYDVYIEETSNNPEFKSVIRYIDNKDNQGYREPKTLSENKYIDSVGYLGVGATSTYKIKLWLDYNANNTYMDKEFKAKIIVKSYQSNANDILKSKLVKYEESSKDTFQGGLVAVNTNGELYNENDANQEIREYRYSGPSVNNYVTFNDENWRIIGVFKDENGEEHMKIIRNEALLRTIMPDTYEVGEKTFRIKHFYDSNNYAYWNYPKTGTNYNDWTTAGLMYWLNSKGTTDGYLNMLTSEAQNMIYETTWNLGNVVYTDSPNQAYEHERGSIVCTPASSRPQCKGGDIYLGNSGTWEGKIALMYPSDYGFSTSISYWNSIMFSWSGTQLNATWLREGHNVAEWFLSPSSNDSVWIYYLHEIGQVVDNVVAYEAGGVRPTLYLKSNVKIVDGDGSKNNQYKLSIDE